MKNTFLSSLALACVFSTGLTLAPLAKADEWNKRTVVTFNNPVEIPGMVLTPGTYVMKLVDSPWNRDVVQFFNATETHIYNTVITIPTYRDQPADHTVITFHERAAGAPEAINEWFYPGDLRGEEFIYSKPHPLTVAQATNLTPRPAQPVAAPAAAPAPQVKATPAAGKPKPVEVAQAKPAPAASPAPPAPAQPAKELPKTAGNMPLLALLGALSASAGVWLMRKHA